MTVDHLATKCGSMLYHNYEWSHNEVARSLHLLLCNKYDLTQSRKLQTHRIQSVRENSNVCIKVVYDKVAEAIVIVKVCIMYLDRLKTVEVEKRKNYDLLPNEL
ncbi:uncharacterized protein LOC115228974 [Octopus sinensis]|uniref:Uncharacterized protein LOC115228974 n=1 Tax=Octopus sinensis TaxID=2607531 RepID=A0A6P7TZB6_9MOLL|nr:uncharacterized protein LOC115228974 [Octopus sinensis]